MNILTDCHLQLETPAGILVRGVPLQELQEHLGDSVTGVQPSVSWNVLVGQQETLRVTAAELRVAMRRWFDWEEVVTRTSHLLNLMGCPKTLVSRRGRQIAGLALGDDWPAKVDRWEALLAGISASGKVLFPMNEQGLIWLLLDALQEPWHRGKAPVPDDCRSRRFARLVFIAADGSGLDLGPVRPSAAAPEVAHGFATARTLVPIARLNELDNPRVLLVRSYELYVEFLAEKMPEVLQRFEEARGIGARDWIVGAATLAHIVETLSLEEEPKVPIVLTDVATQLATHSWTTVMKRLSRTPEYFARRISELLPELQHGELPVQVLREAPVLQLDDSRYLIMHDDFIKAQADDGVLYTILDLLEKREKGAFLEAFGGAVESYIFRILERCAGVVKGGGVVARVARSDRSKEKRCDFIWSLAGLTIFMESKRLGLGAKLLHGRAELGQRLEHELGEACRQILETKRALSERGSGHVCPALAQRPISSRAMAIVVTHRPAFAWYSTRREILPSEIRDQWLNEFGAPPAIWSLSELELFEASLPTFGIERTFEAFVSDRPDTYGGLAEFLTRNRYDGTIASPYYENRAREIRQRTDGSDPSESADKRE